MLASLLQKIQRMGPLFILTVAAPTAISILYFGLLASDIYVSESRFIVRNPEKPAVSGVGVLLKSVGYSSSGDDVFAVQDYITSRDGLRALNEKEQFRNAYSGKDVSIFDRFGTILSGEKFENLYKYYLSKVRVENEASSSIVTLTVRAYSAEDAERFNAELLNVAEAMVNRLNARARHDVIGYAEREVKDAQQRAQSAALALSAYRNREGVVDPEKQAVVQLQMISKLQDELIATRTQLAELRSLAPRNSQIDVLEMRVKSLSAEMDEQLGRVAGDRKSLSSSAARFQRLTLDNDLASKQLASALAALDDARNEARRKQSYLARIAQPNRPDYPLEPRRFRSILATLVLGLVSWGILSMLFVGIREHAN